MRKNFKRLLVSLMAFALLSSSIICFAAEDDQAWINETRQEIEVLGEGGVALKILPEDVSNTRLVDLTPESSGTSTGNINSSFVVPNAYSGCGVKIMWGARAKNSNVNTTLVLRVYNSSGSRVSTVYLPVTSETHADGYSIGNLPAGTYSYTISPNGTAPGEFVYIMKFYVFP